MKMLRFWTVAGLILILSACASGQAGPDEAAEPDPDAITLQVENQFRSAVRISTVFMPSRSQRLLGRVRAGRREEFSFPWRLGNMYLLVEDQAYGGEAFSNPITLDERHRGVTIILTVNEVLRPIVRIVPPGSRR